MSPFPCMSVAPASQSCCNLYVGTLVLSLLLQLACGTYTFVIFLILMIFFTIFVYICVPETKGKTIEEIAGRFAPAGDRIEVSAVACLG